MKFPPGTKDRAELWICGVDRVAFISMMTNGIRLISAKKVHTI